jgi:hypothetical protein
LAVAFGIGTAVLVGGGGGIAAADDTGAATSHDNTSAPGPATGSSTGADSTTNETPKSTPKTPRGSSTAAGHTDADVDADVGEKADERSGREGETADHGTAYSESGGTESDADTGPGTDVKPKRVAGGTIGPLRNNPPQASSQAIGVAVGRGRRHDRRTGRPQRRRGDADGGSSAARIRHCRGGERIRRDHSDGGSIRP